MHCTEFSSPFGQNDYLIYKLINDFSGNCFKDTHRENTPSNKTQALTKSMNISIWVVSTLKQLFIKSSYALIKFSEKQSN